MFLPPLEIENNAKFCISFVLKCLSCFSLHDDIFVSGMAETFEKLLVKK